MSHKTLLTRLAKLGRVCACIGHQRPMPAPGINEQNGLRALFSHRIGFAERKKQTRFASRKHEKRG